MFLGQHSDANSIVKSIVYSQLVGLDRWLSGQEEADFSEAHRFQINRYFDKPSDFIPPSVNRLPDGSPIVIAIGRFFLSVFNDSIST